MAPDGRDSTEQNATLNRARREMLKLIAADSRAEKAHADKNPLIVPKNPSAGIEYYYLPYLPGARPLEPSGKTQPDGIICKPVEIDSYYTLDVRTGIVTLYGFDAYNARLKGTVLNEDETKRGIGIWNFFGRIANMGHGFLDSDLKKIRDELVKKYPLTDEQQKEMNTNRVQY